MKTFVITYIDNSTQELKANSIDDLLISIKDIPTIKQIDVIKTRKIDKGLNYNLLSDIFSL